MSAKLRGAVARGKNKRFPERNQNFPSGNQISEISPVMQKVRGLLDQPKSAHQLAKITGEPLSICQKVLSGHRVENRDLLIALTGRTAFAGDVFLVMSEDNPHPRVRVVREAIELALAEFDYQERRKAIQSRGGR